MAGDFTSMAIGRAVPATSDWLCDIDLSQVRQPPPPPAKGMILPADPAARKRAPITTGVLGYFPLAVAAVAHCSLVGNEQHHPGEPLHWDRTKSLDHADCIARHLIDRGSYDTDGIRHSAKLAWRALALLQTELEDAAAILPNRS